MAAGEVLIGGSFYQYPSQGPSSSELASGNSMHLAGLGERVAGPEETSDLPFTIDVTGLPSLPSLELSEALQPVIAVPARQTRAALAAPFAPSPAA